MNSEICLLLGLILGIMLASMGVYRRHATCHETEKIKFKYIGSCLLLVLLVLVGACVYCGCRPTDTGGGIESKTPELSVAPADAPEEYFYNELADMSTNPTELNTRRDVFA